MKRKDVVIERFAPSPTGYLHLGHAFSALTAYNKAKKSLGILKLRIEDIDNNRCKKKFERQIFKDLHWLGIKWSEPVLKQSNRRHIYNKTLYDLKNKGLIYKCNCSRKDIKNALSAPHRSDRRTTVYPGTCLNKHLNDDFVSLRLNMRKALQTISSRRLEFIETGYNNKKSVFQRRVDPEELLTNFGDIVIARKDIGTSYNLAVVVDDAMQGITHVTRGEDLFEITPIQILLQNLLDIQTPIYHHHKLILDSFGNRLAKRSYSESLLSLREKGMDQIQIFELISSDKFF
ncbi:MAG: tRNA glutamyl-Q(34) synthetase GluQRS [Pseudomonadota bacterium]|nr:tRNA glutamyl-Q(34) synthetase GluQRS [Pseudomonadota bacterium]